MISAVKCLQPSVGAGLLIIYLFKDVYYKSHQALLSFISKGGLWGGIFSVLLAFIRVGLLQEKGIFLGFFYLKLGFTLLTETAFSGIANEETWRGGY